MGIALLETSAKDGSNVDQIFERIVEELSTDYVSVDGGADDGASKERAGDLKSNKPIKSKTKN